MPRMIAFTATFVLVLASAASAVDYSVGLRFDDGSTAATVDLTQKAYFQLFITTADAAASMKEYLVGFSGSTASDGGTLNDLTFASNANMLANWSYVNSLTGSIDSRLISVSADSPSDDLAGLFSTVVDTLSIDALAEGTYTLAPDLSNFDVLVADRNDAAPGNALESGYEAVTQMVVPEPATFLLFVLAGGVLR